MFWKNDNSKAAESAPDSISDLRKQDEIRKQADSDTCNQEPVTLKRLTEAEQIMQLRFEMTVLAGEIQRLNRENRILRGDFNLLLEFYGKEVEEVAPQPAFRRLVERGSVKGGPEPGESQGGASR